MAQWQAGARPQAQVSLAKARSLADSKLADYQGLTWNDNIIAHHLLGEAERLFQRQAASGEPEK
jgi:hypothetical protein